MEFAVAARKRILLGQLAARGDCLYATAVARQIKVDYPGCHLTWAIGSTCRSVIDGNPDVDAVWEMPLADPHQPEDAWHQFVAAAQERLKQGDFDAAFFTQIYPANYKNFDGTVRASIFRGYPRPITVPVAPVIRLSADEVENVRRFAEQHRLADHHPVILFEYVHRSGQSFIDPNFLSEAIDRIAARLPNGKIILSSHVPMETGNPATVSADVLSFRENAELTKYCSLLIGCSSGITWLCTSDWAKPLPSIQLLKRETGVYASVVHDHEYFGLPTESVIEMTDCPAEDLADCVAMVIQNGFGAAKNQYHQQIDLRLDFHIKRLDGLIECGAYQDAFSVAGHMLRRYGPRPAIISLFAHVAINALRTAIKNSLRGYFQK